MRAESGGQGRTGRGREVDASVAWLAAPAAAAVALLAIELLGPPLGKVLFPIETSAFWPSALVAVRPEPTEAARYLLALIAAILVPGYVLWLHRRPTRPEVPRKLVLVLQVVFVAVLVLAIFCRRGSVHIDLSYFGKRTALVALAICIAFVWVLSERGGRIRARIGQVLGLRSRPIRWGAAALAALATAIWLLPAIQLNTTVLHAQPATFFDLIFTYDEGLSVVNGHSTLVNYVAQYGSLWPYVIALPMHWGNGSLGAFTISMATITGIAMLAVYGVIRRVVESPVAALLLFLAFMATSFFILRGTPVHRYSFADYFGVFPLRYAGPFFVLYMLARHLCGEWPRKAGWIFLVAGLAVLNNGDFGLPALGAAAVAVVAAADVPRTRRWFGERVGEALVGLLGAFALVSIVTVARTGQLPDISLLFRYAHLFAVAGYDLVRMPWFGVWVAVYLTFCAALVVAALLMTRGNARRIEIGTLAWTGIFGLGAGSYYAGRSNSEVLIAVFSAWALAIVLLVVVAVRDLLRRGGDPSPAQLALFAGFGLLVCSLAQFPAPWQSIARLERNSPEILHFRADADFIRANSRPGEPVALITNLGQLISREADVFDVTPYSGIPSMPTRIQLTETLDQLREEGGTKVFIRDSPETWPEMIPAMERVGFRQVKASEPPGPEGVTPPDRLVLLSDAGGAGSKKSGR